MNLFRPSSRLGLALASGLFVSGFARAHGQAAAPPPAALCLDARVESAGLDAELLRLQMERELGLAVARASAGAPSCLVIEAPSLTAVRVAFTRADGTVTERTLDVSMTGAHKLETIALLGANLVRDEAAELLAALQKQPASAAPQPQPAPGSPPAPALAPTPTPTPALAPGPTAKAEPPRPSGCDPTGLRRVVVGADFLPYLGSSLLQGTDVERRVSLNALGSVNDAVRGFELSGLFSIDRRSLCGVQVSGIFNLVMGPIDGAQIALVNVARGVHGAQLGLLSTSAGPVEGVQVGMANVGTGLEGAQLGLVNTNAGPRDGVQIGLANVTSGAAHGAQIGVVNVGGPLQGAQLGLANVSNGPVQGAMIGLLNVAEYADVAIAPLSILSRGRTHLDVWGTDAGLLMAGVEHGSVRVHNVFAIGGTVRESRGVFAFSYGIGVRLFEDARLFVDIDAIAYGLVTRNPELDRIEITMIDQLRIPVSFRLNEDVALFLAPSVSVGIARHDDLITDPSLYGSTRLTKRDADFVLRIWPGFNIGGRFF